MTPTTLTRDKWVTGQRAYLIWHDTLDSKAYLSSGTLRERDDFLRGQGVYFMPDDPETRESWQWDFMIEGGIGGQSPLYEL